MSQACGSGASCAASPKGGARRATIQALTLIQLCQLLGETLARMLGLPVPGPVLGMGLMLTLLALSERVAALVVPAGEGILRHLALLFVPAGVGVVGHLDRLTGNGWRGDDG